MIPVFYARCLEADYPEGHIQAVRMFVRSLQQLATRPEVFDFEYGRNDVSQRNSSIRIRRFPFISTESANQRTDPRTVAPLLFEAFSSLYFGTAEQSTFQGRRDVVVNLTNCFRYARLLDPRLHFPVVLHYYMREPSCKLLGNWLSQKADGFLVSSESVRQYLTSECRVPQKKIKIAYPPVDTSIYQPQNKSDVRQAFHIKRDSKIVLYMGSLKEGRFSIPTVLQALSETARVIPSVMLLVAVPDRIEDRRRASLLVRAAAKSGLSDRIILQIKNLDNEEKSALYALSDLFIYPASKRAVATEPPLTVLESMACGTPILACKEPSVEEIIVNPECGEIVSCDVTSLTRALVGLLSAEERLRTLSSNCRSVALTNFSPRVSGTILLEWFAEILNESRHG